MARLVSPFCLLLALAMAVAGFGLLAVGTPEASTELHSARVRGDQQHEEALEARLRRRQLARKMLIGCLLVGSAVFGVAALVTLRPAEADGPHS